MDPSKIAIVAEHLPGDLSINYASPYAGAYFSLCIDDDLLKYSKLTYENLPKLVLKLGPNCGIGRCKSSENIQEGLDPEYVEKLKFAEEFKLEPSGVEGFHSVVLYRAFIFNSPVLITNILNYVKGLGVSVKRVKLAHINEALDLTSKVVFNCCGNGAIKLGGVEDSLMVPTRGQVVVIRAPHINECVLSWDDKSTYIIKRPDSNLDEVILGGFYQKDITDPTVYGHETEDILERTTKLFPDILLKNPNGPEIKDLQIIRVVAGVRPGRAGGVRIAKELVGGKTIIHNYGAGGNGYLAGLGMSIEAVKLALDV